MGPFPTPTHNNCYVVVAIDYLTKLIEAEALVGQSAVEVAEFFQKLINRFGVMAVVRSDQGAHFQGRFSKAP